MHRACPRAPDLCVSLHVGGALVGGHFSGDLAENSGDFPMRPEWEKEWSPKTGVRLESAYKQVDGKEPDFTNNAKVRLTAFRAFSAAPRLRLSSQAEGLAPRGFSGSLERPHRRGGLSLCQWYSMTPSQRACWCGSRRLAYPPFQHVVKMERRRRGCYRLYNQRLYNQRFVEREPTRGFKVGDRSFLH